MITILLKLEGKAKSLNKNEIKGSDKDIR